jgi:MOSC domain-containing protein YiiM
MHPVASAQLESGKGIVGDRYHTGRGAFSKKLAASGKDDWQITLIESEEIESFLTSAQLPFGPGDFRRNVITAGIRLNPLVGRIFLLDGVRLQGVRLCEPCSYLAKLLGKKVLPAMAGRCGLRARILDDGLVRKGGPIETQGE